VSVNPASEQKSPNEQPSSVQLATFISAELVATKPPRADAAVAEIEAAAADNNGTLDIKSLSQGTLEPLAVDRVLAASSLVAPPPASDDNQTPPLPASVRPPSNRRTALFISFGALLAVGVAAIALRHTSPKSVGATASTEARERSIAADTAVAAATATTQGALPTAPGANQTAELPAPESANAAATVATSAGRSHEDAVRVAINIRPEGARVYYRGREVGRTPFTVELLRGERRVFEVGAPGYATRRLVIDGTRKEISYIMTPETK
jgi:hypothetical protein